MKHLEDTPWWICDPEDTNYVAYSDTDSISTIVLTVSGDSILSDTIMSHYKCTVCQHLYISVQYSIKSLNAL